MSTEQNIQVTPRAAAYLAAIKVALDAQHADAQHAIERQRAERIRAAAESRRPEFHCCTAGTPPAPALTADEIASRALEEGAAQLLHQLTSRSTQPGLGYPCGGDGTYPIAIPS
jgi:non-ribosomal peptide synthetase component F